MQHGIKYAMLTEQRLLGTYVLVMATEALCPRISQVQTATVPTGLGVSNLGLPEKGRFLMQVRVLFCPSAARQCTTHRPTNPLRAVDSGL